MEVTGPAQFAIGAVNVDDLSSLAAAATEIGGKVEALRQEEMKRLVSQAELRVLQSQINPHFLFNALNTLYGTIPRESAAARRMVLNLADIFRSFLQTDRSFATLAEESRLCARISKWNRFDWAAGLA